MKRKFINKDGIVVVKEVGKQHVPYIGFFDDNHVWWQRKYSSSIIRLNSWLSKRAADVLRYG